MNKNTIASGGSKVAQYNFQQPPKSVAVSGTYRDPQIKSFISGNIMHDHRVVRGNTYAQVIPVPPPPVMSGTSSSSTSGMANTRRAPKESNATMQRSKATFQVGARGSMNERPPTPEAVEGRKHIELQTEEYREALTEAVQEMTQETQTDPLLDRPHTPLFVPFKNGRDAETQIEEGELFNFDAEVEPLLEVMIGKTLEQAMLEVLQEEELEALHQQQLDFEQRRKEEAMEAQRLEASEKRKFEEKERRKQQEMARIRREKEAREKLEARIFAKAFLGTLENRVFARLEDEGWFFDAVEREIELEFMPWLLNRTDAELEKKRKTKALLDSLIKESVLSLMSTPLLN